MIDGAAVRAGATFRPNPRLKPLAGLVGIVKDRIGQVGHVRLHQREAISTCWACYVKVIIASFGADIVTGAVHIGGMPYRREDAAYLRHKAAQFRALADEMRTPISAKLREIAAELDAYAAAIEKRPDPRRPN